MKIDTGATPFSPGALARMSSARTNDVLFMFAAAAAAVFLVLSVQVANPLQNGMWHQPSWFRSPFLLREPLQFMHLAGFHFLAVGLGMLVRALFSQGGRVDKAFVVAAAGCGVLVGVRLCMLAYRGRIRPRR